MGPMATCSMPTTPATASATAWPKRGEPASCCQTLAVATPSGVAIVASTTKEPAEKAMSMCSRPTPWPASAANAVLTASRTAPNKVGMQAKAS